MPSDPNEQFEILFRLYGPRKEKFEKKWTLPDVTDPKEEYPQTAVRNSWNAGPAMKIVSEFEASLNKHAPIAPGTPDPYTPPR